MKQDIKDYGIYDPGYTGRSGATADTPAFSRRLHRKVHRASAPPDKRRQQRLAPRAPEIPPATSPLGNRHRLRVTVIPTKRQANTGCFVKSQKLGRPDSYRNRFPFGEENLQDRPSRGVCPDASNCRIPELPTLRGWRRLKGIAREKIRPKDLSRGQKDESAKGPQGLEKTAGVRGGPRRKALGGKDIRNEDVTGLYQGAARGRAGGGCLAS